MSSKTSYSSPENEVIQRSKLLRKAVLEAAPLSSETRSQAVLAMADAILTNQKGILKENQKDLDAAKSQGVTEPLQDRLLLTPKRIKEMAMGLRKVAEFSDPLGEIISMRERPSGIRVGLMRVPIGAIGMIYEARPNVTADAAGLCVKSGNCVLLRGGSMAFHSNQKITEIIARAAESRGGPVHGIQSIQSTDRRAVDQMLQLREYIDVVIPRGGAKFIKEVISKAKVPVIETGAGNCHLYIDHDADVDMAIELLYNGKVQRPSVCNATKKVLVHQDKAKQVLPRIRSRLGSAGVSILVDEQSKVLLPDSRLMQEEEWYEEFLDMRLGVKIVSSIEEAIQHINKYGSRHTEAIVTPDYTRATLFIKSIDAASVMWNASTRFTDGNQFGLGAEIGISTQKLHARGPMGIDALTTTKWITFGTGQIRK